MKDEKRRILFIAPSAYPFGGVADWLEYLLPGLRDLGWECVLGLVDGACQNAERYLHRHPFPNVELINNKSGSAEGRIKAVTSVIERTAPDIVAVVNIVDAYHAIRRLRQARDRAPRVVMTLHGLQSEFFGDVSEQSDVVDSVIVTNRLTQRLVQRIIADQERVLYAPYGVPAMDYLSPSGRGSQETMRILYSGRLDIGQKRVFDLPLILQVLSDRSIDVELSLAGEGASKDNLRGVFRELGQEQRVKFLGDLGRKELGDAYRSHDALIVTSEWETGPIVAWEAMSCGLPVISSRYLGSRAEGALINEVNCLLFDIGNVKEAADAVDRLRDVSICHTIVSGGYHLVKTRYSREVSIAKWGDAFKRIATLPPTTVSRRLEVVSPRGRLDRWFGVSAAEWIRGKLGIGFRHIDAGGEWPHSGHRWDDQATFIEYASQSDMQV